MTKIQYSISALLSLIIPGISFFLLLVFLGADIESTIFTAATFFIIAPLGSIVLAVTVIRRKEQITKTEATLTKLGIILASVTIISFFWFQYL
ncbi:MAG: hypothetical protein COY66_06775 [Candidatus Kerfeldbacteria bacterium CG_4_10_14_0_8_um_filter_42_10]|uniref:Uncharacterized protein n=1 Tax=Candidatus Kerfeldbacteria bacterium CG_4_10_14_0_8_um_filter_42_10 TaxID=2014248 RepID=A0A2M7RG03_9BACT|nr:MAG: hypothetical protein COY66_06775 [Candidatus Kerfeldbacteria bacterium CG_4_10_14_0_8_um_filter_42_10]